MTHWPPTPRSDSAGRPFRILSMLVFAAALLTPWAAAQNPPSNPVGHEIGYPFLENYYAADYDAHVWNATAIQDDRGILYVANNDGLLEFDGVSWRLIVLPGRSHVRSLARDDTGRIWVAGAETFGFIDADSLGQTTVISLRDRLVGGGAEDSVVRRILSAPDGIYVITTSHVVRYQPDEDDAAVGTVTSWPLDPPSTEVFLANGRLYSRQTGIGLSELVGGEVVPLPGGSRFADESVQVLLPYAGGGLLVGTQNSDLFVFDGHSFRRWETEADALLATHSLTSGAALREGRFALGTRTGGVAIVDREGRLEHQLDTSLGLQSNYVNGISPDDSGGLWLALDRGLTRIDLESPLSVYDAHSGLNDVALVVTRFNDRLYAGTTTGLVRLDEQGRQFTPVSGPQRAISALFAAHGELLAGTESGLHRLEGDRLVPLGNSRSTAYALALSSFDSNILYVGLNEGLRVFRRRSSEWTDMGLVPGVDDIIRSIVVQEGGDLWLGTDISGAYRVHFPAGRPADLEGATVRYFGPDDGLPEAGASAYSVDGKAYFTSFGAEVYSFDNSLQRFERDHTFDAVATGYPLDWFGFHEDRLGRVWIPLGNRGMSMVGPNPDGTYTPAPGPLRRLGSMLIIVAFPEDDGVVWMAGSEGLVRYDTSKPIVRPERLPVLIRSVLANADSLLYAGGGSAPNVRLAYRDNTVRFEYALPSLSGPSDYRTRLDGFDDDWSDWKTETARTYTNLPEGTYTFRVVARDIDEIEAPEATFSFSISPPWWRSGWAYTMYVLAFGAILFGIRQYEVNRLRLKHGLKLKQVESERLRELDEVKSRFFGNISHEFRTPLTLILGPVRDAIERKSDLPAAQLSVVQRHGRRLLRLVNQLLDLSKLEGGNMRLRTSRADLVSFLRSIVFSFDSMAEQKQIALGFESSPERIEVYFERDKMEQVFYNLLSNAFAFTPDGGSITVECHADAEHVRVEVQDSGIGIPSEHLTHIFDRFYQVDATSTRKQGGTGIGLALTKALVELHRGDISVSSEEGQGTTFRVTVPLGNAHLTVDEQVEVAVDAEPGPVVVDNDLQENGSMLDTDTADEREVVLIVEDSADVRVYIRDHLSESYRVLEAADGKSGLATAQEEMPDLIVTDVMMPQMDGLALSRALREDERTSHIPIVMLTAKAGEEDKLKGLDTGVDDYLLKPFRPRELQARVRNLIALRRRLRKRFSTKTYIKPSEIEATNVDQAFLERVVGVVESRLEDTGLSVGSLADEVGMSDSQLTRKLRALVDQTPGQLIRSMRLKTGADLLEHEAGTIAEIAYRVGFSNQAHFSTAFKSQFGVTPSEYRENPTESL